MSVTYVNRNAVTNLSSRIDAALRKGREARDEMKECLAILQRTISGDASDSSQFTVSASVGGYSSVTDAYNSWLELNSYYSKLSCPGGQTVADVSPAIDQACSKHGV